MNPGLSSLLETANGRVQVPPEARFTPAEQFSEVVGFDYLPIGVFRHPDTGEWVATGGNPQFHSPESFRETFPSKKAATRFVADEKLSLAGSYSFRYATIYDESNDIEEILFSDGWETYRVMQSRAGDGWVHGLRGDHDYNPGHDDKQAIIEGAKESVVSNGYDKLLIENENQEVETVWVNCFLGVPDLPWRQQ